MTIQDDLTYTMVTADVRSVSVNRMPVTSDGLESGFLYTVSNAFTPPDGLRKAHDIEAGSQRDDVG
jgi:hypothetical protein